MGISIENLNGPGQHYFIKQGEYLFFSFLFANMFMQDELFGNLFATADNRVQGSHRFLKNHPYLVAPEGLHSGFGGFQDIQRLGICFFPGIEKYSPGGITDRFGIQ